MFNAINEVKRQYTYAVQPVKLFEAKNRQELKKNPFDMFNNQTNFEKYNLHHPNISNSNTGSRLDFLG